MKEKYIACIDFGGKLFIQHFSMLGMLVQQGEASEMLPRLYMEDHLKNN